MKWVVLIGSAAGHLAAVFGLDRLAPESTVNPPTTITMVEAPAPPEPEAPEPPKPEPVAEDAPEAKNDAPTPSPAAASPKPAQEPSTPTTEALPDLGLELVGTSSGGPGLAVAAGGGGSGAPRVRERRTLSAAPVPARVDPSAACQDGPSPKPQLVNFQKPSYSETARAAGVTGKVRVSITVGADGRVEQVTILQGLGHGLDEATVAAVRAASFSAAVACGKNVRSTFTMSVRFSAD